MAPILGIWASSRATAADTGAMFPLQVITVGPAGASSVSFTNIPNTYTHLQIRGTVLTSTSTNYLLGFNNDAGTNYTAHRIMGDGASASAAAFTSINRSYIGYIPNTSYPSSCVIDILDYANTNKNKTFRTLEGSDVNGATGYITLWSGLWLNTAAINTVNIVPVSGTFANNATFALYGIKGA